MIGKEEIKKAIKALKAGGVIIYPTDTAYALGGIFNDNKVIRKILKLKKRKNEKFTLIASSASQIKKYFKLNKEELRLAKKYWPGPLSIVVSNNYAARVPANKIARKLARGAGKPIIATSVNIAKRPAAYSIKEIKKQFGLQVDSNKKREVDFVLDAGELKNKKTSTIVKVKNKEIATLRQGALKL